MKNYVIKAKEEVEKYELLLEAKCLEMYLK